MSRVVDSVSPEELATRRRVLETLQSYTSARDPYVVHANDFQEVLASLGLRFGSDFVDRVMLLCNIDSSGMVSVCLRCGAPHAIHRGSAV